MSHSRLIRHLLVSAVMYVGMLAAAVPVAAQDPGALAREGYLAPPKEIGEALVAPWHRNIDLDDPSPDGRYFVVERDGPAYTLTWEAGSIVVGEGILMGDELGTSYGSEACGVAVYAVRGDDLDGRWTSYAAGALGSERAARR